MNKFDRWVINEPSCVGYWPLLNDLVDLKAGNNLVVADVLNGDGAFTNWSGDNPIGFTVSIAETGTNYVTQSSGKCRIVTDGAGQGIFKPSSPATLVVGKTYNVKCDISNFNSGLLWLGDGNLSTGGQNISPPFSGTVNFNFVATNAGVLAFMRVIGGAGEATIDNYEIREAWTPNQTTGGGVQLNGASNCLQTIRPVNLSNTNKITIFADIKWLSYNLTAQAVVIEFSNIPTSTAGAFSLSTNGSVAGDPLVAFLRGNVGNVEFRYNIAGMPFLDKLKHFICMTGNFGLSTDEVASHIEGVAKTPDTKTTNNNNTGNFGNHTMYLGMRAGLSLPSEITISNLALFSNKAFTEEEQRTAYNLFKSSYRTSRFVSIGVIP